MSWAEIKKAINSNIDVPLDTRMSCGFVKTMYSHATGVGPSLNIQGKGVLNHIWYRQYVDKQTTSPRLKITVDDNVIFDKCVKNSNTSNEAEVRLGFTSCAVMLQSDGVIIGGGIWHSNANDISYGEIVVTRYTKTVEMSSSPETCVVYQPGSSLVGYYFIVTDKPLAFNKSLKIETIGTTTQTVIYYIQYELYE